MPALVFFNSPTGRVRRCDVMLSADKGRQKREGKTEEGREERRGKGRQRREGKREGKT